MALITLTEFKAAREVANTLEAKRFDPMLEDVEFTEIQSRLGLEFYAAIVASPGDYTVLLEAGSYTYNSKNYRNPGLKSVIIDFVYAVYKSIGHVTDTPFGNSIKLSDHSEQADRQTRKDLKGHYERIAGDKWAMVNLYLDRNSSTYPLWRYNSYDDCPRPGGSFGIQKIS